MASKTFIKVRTGILSPTHINNMGNAVWLYLYILSRADWETGKVFQWRDQDAADDLGLYIQTIRKYRKKLEGIYIDCTPRGNGLNVMIRKWSNPRIKAAEDDTNISHSGDTHVSQENQSSDTESDTESDTVVDTIVSSIPFNSELRFQRTELNDNSEKLLSRFVEIFGIDYVPASLVERGEWMNIITRLVKAGVSEDIMSKAKANIDRRVTHPAQIIAECGRLLNAGAVIR